MQITLEKNNIEKIKTLLNYIGSNYVEVPLRIFRKIDINGNDRCYVEVKVGALDASEVFSSNLELDDIKDLELNKEIMIRLPLNKTTLNILFSSFDTLKIDEVSIRAKTNKKELNMALMVLNKVYTYELHNEDLYHHYRKDDEYIIFTPVIEEIKEFISLFSTLKITSKDVVNINIYTCRDGLMVTAKDKMDSVLKYKFTTNNLYNEDVEIDSDFGYSFINMLNRLVKIKSEDIPNIRVLVSDVLIATTCWNDKLVMTYGVPSK